jgi:small GTP-binding protein
MVQVEDTIHKVVLVGEAGVGKTSLVKRFVHNKFDEKYQKTLGTNVYKKDVEVEIRLKKKTIHLQIWDLLGQKAFQSIIKSAFRGARGIMLVCDITNMESIKNLETWIDMSFKNAPKSTFIFLANKTDLPNWQFGYKELKQFASLFESPFLLTSAKTGENVESAFNRLAKAIEIGKYMPPEYEKIVQSKQILISPIIKAEDDIIMEFCNEVGDFEISMPYVREQFQKLDIDFENPTKEDLENVITNLADTIRFIKGDDEAEQVERKLRKILAERGIA